jgi:hypothetical protein
LYRVAHGTLDTLLSAALVFVGRSKANSLTWGFSAIDAVMGGIVMLELLSILMLFSLVSFVRF